MNLIMGGVRNGYSATKPAIAGTTVSARASTGTIIKAATNSYGNYGVSAALSNYVLAVAPAGFHSYATGALSNMTGTLKAYFSLWPLNVTIPPKTVVYSNTGWAKAV